LRQRGDWNEYVKRARERAKQPYAQMTPAQKKRYEQARAEVLGDAKKRAKASYIEAMQMPDLPEKAVNTLYRQKRKEAAIARNELINNLRESPTEKKLDKRMRDLTSRMGTAENKAEIYQGIRDINAKRREIEKIRQQRSMDITRVESPSRGKIGKRKGEKLHEKTINDGMEGFNSLVHDNPFVGTVDVNGLPLGGRANYNLQNQININAMDSRSVFIHEMGHYLEDVDPNVLGLSKKFLERRTAGESAMSMGDATGNPNYSSGEITKKDRFQNPYIGKIYKSKWGVTVATEIMSMGLQMFYEDPAKLARLDPDLFDHVYAVARLYE